MLVKSSKSRVAAIAIMALGVSTFMGTSAALADVNVSGTVGECQAASTVSASAVAFGEVKRDTVVSKPLTATITQGKTSTCADRASTVSASIGTFTGAADPDVAFGDQVTVRIADVSSEVFSVTADVPAGATANQSFGATVTLTLSNNT
jgi:hypothetical protein